MKIALVNTNRISPPIGPIGLEYVAEATARSGHSPQILDLCWERDVRSAIKRFFNEREYDLIGLSIRNTDDCVFGSRQSFIGEHLRIVSLIREHSQAILIAGGSGFSVLPEQVLESTGADAGIWGDGEFVFPLIASRIEKGEDWRTLPNLVIKKKGRWIRNGLHMHQVGDLPLMSRSWFDNKRYYQEGGQAGFESKRGCTGRCVYCADPIAKGREVRTRPQHAVVHELRALTEQGIYHFHTCDSEFNIPLSHAVSVCEGIADGGLGDRIRWYAYCSPVPFSRRLAGLMKRAGCTGINFGTDSGDDRMLKNLGRRYGSEDIARTVGICRDEGITVMLDLLFGAPGETESSVRTTVELMKRIGADCVGVSAGVRVYPGTALSERIAKRRLEGGLIGGNDVDEPLFFMEPQVAPDLFDYLEMLIGGDPRFFFMNPSRPEANYNYNTNQRLVEAIRLGSRGAYWDILRKKRGTDRRGVATDRNGREKL